MQKKQPAIYIVTNKPYGSLYIGVTSDLVKRIFEHKNGLLPKSFTGKYKLKTLVYYQLFETMEEAIRQEKRLKNWHREWKDNLIKEHNPNWFDLSEDILKH